MNEFYVSIIVLGVILIVVSLICIAFDKKGSNDYSKKLDTKKQEIIEVIADAEQMLEELNKFSDYIVTQIDKKNKELSRSLQLADEKLQRLGNSASDGGDSMPLEIELESIDGDEDKVVLSDKRHKDVLDLVDKGFTSAEIAKTLSMGKGEIELILEINK